MNKRDLLKKYKHVFNQPVTLYENFTNKKPLKESYKVYVFHNTAGAERRPTEPQDIWDFQEEDCDNEEEVLEYLCDDLGICEYDDYPTLQDFINQFAQDFSDGSPIVYRIEKDGAPIFEDGVDYFEELKIDLQDQLEGEQDKLYSENGVQRDEILDWLEENHPELYKEAVAVFEDRYGDDLENAFADDIESFIAEENEDAWAEYCDEFGIENYLGESYKSRYLKEELTDDDYDILYEVGEELFNRGYSAQEIRDKFIEFGEAFYDAYSHPDPDEDEEELDEGKVFDFDKINKKLHGNIKLESRLLEFLGESNFTDPQRVNLSIEVPEGIDKQKAIDFFANNLINNITFKPEILLNNSDGTFTITLPGKADWIGTIAGKAHESIYNIDVIEKDIL